VASRRVVELELDPPRLLVLALALVAVLAGAFWIGRATGGGAGPEREPRAAAEPEATEATDAGDVSETETIFDRAGDGGAVRELGRQVTGELALGGRFELDLGMADTRNEAERLRSEAARLDVPAVVVGAPGGKFRVAAGPFSTRSQAEQAAGRLREELAREVVIRSSED
jgi:cell division protein FtsN